MTDTGALSRQLEAIERELEAGAGLTPAGEALLRDVLATIQAMLADVDRRKGCS